MTRKKNQIIIITIFFILCAAIIITAPILATTKYSDRAEKNDLLTVLTVWQIDSFEGGKGSRASYLKNIGDRFSKSGGCYIDVVSLTSSAALNNITLGTIPDLISYGAGMYGIEKLICGKTPYVTWAHGGYCFLALDENADFSDILPSNVVVNSGIENMSDVAALMCGIQGATKEKPTGAYVSLINGKYKYLLGTQRDIYRLNTRGASFKLKPITEFNDLYQNISITTINVERQKYARKFIDYLLTCSDELIKLGLMGDTKLYEDEMGMMENLTYECRLMSPISESIKREVQEAVTNSDIKKLKNLFK